ncbi:HAAS signaling domain-containing protein [Plantibacter sp. Mn2098]|uniref:HAAS signaling domain-containing protein n=1 Tax=Plantibacter sp. Mn2098 TaxID=3395266 RepID=UPI003BECA76D
MSSSNAQSAAAKRYLTELNDALADASPAVRSEIVADITDELDGLDDAAAAARVAELGDPRAIAADAAAATAAVAPESVSPDSAIPVQPVPSKAYLTITGLLLTAGWYVVPVLGWVAGIVMVAIGTSWTSPVRRNAIIASIGSIVLAGIVLIVFRGTGAWYIGLGGFVLLPLIGNAFVADYLRRHWAGR